MKEIFAIPVSPGGIFQRIDSTRIDKHMNDGWRPVDGDAGLVLDIEGLFPKIHSDDMVDEGDLHHPAGATDKGTTQAGDDPLLICGDFSYGRGKQDDKYQ